MRWFRSLPSGSAVLLLVIAGCAHAIGPSSRFGYDQWSIELTRKAIRPAEAVFPFDTTPEMESWVADVVRRFTSLGSLKQLEALQRALFDEEFGFTYEPDLTLTAAHAFAERRGNCMSFTALFVAMARSAGIPVFLMSVRRDPEIDKEDDLVIVNRHVVAGYRTADGVRIFDFYVTTSGPYIQQRVIDDVLASAMYHTNLGAMAIRAARLEEAVRHLRIATTLAPEWAAGWVNLGVASFRTGDTDQALRAYRTALEADPNNSSALTNMAYLYFSEGMKREAEMALRAAAHRTTNPFTLIAMADAEMTQGNYGSARRYLKKAKWWYRSEPEVYEALARLSRHQGNLGKADQYALRAAQLRADQRDRELALDG